MCVDKQTPEQSVHHDALSIFSNLLSLVLYGFRGVIAFLTNQDRSGTNFHWLQNIKCYINNQSHMAFHWMVAAPIVSKGCSRVRWEHGLAVW